MEPLYLDLASLETDPEAIWEYYQKVQACITRLTPLKEILRQTSDEAIAAGLYHRAEILGVATLHPETLLLLRRIFHEEGLNRADYLSELHLPTFQAREKQLLLPNWVHVQKTVTLLLDGKLLLVTSLLDGRLLRVVSADGDSTPGLKKEDSTLLGRKERVRLITRLGLSPKTTHHFWFNPRNHAPEKLVGQLRGIVNLFIQPCYLTQLQIVHLPWPQEWEDNDHQANISISPIESVFIPLHRYRRIVHSYIEHIMQTPYFEQIGEDGEIERKLIMLD